MRNVSLTSVQRLFPAALLLPAQWLPVAPVMAIDLPRVARVPSQAEQAFPSTSFGLGLVPVGDRVHF